MSLFTNKHLSPQHIKNARPADLPLKIKNLLTIAGYEPGDAGLRACRGGQRGRQAGNDLGQRSGRVVGHDHDGHCAPGPGGMDHPADGGFAVGVGQRGSDVRNEHDCGDGHSASVTLAHLQSEGRRGARPAERASGRRGRPTADSLEGRYSWCVRQFRSP